MPDAPSFSLNRPRWLPDLPAVIYNSPYYGFETKAALFFDLIRTQWELFRKWWSVWPGATRVIREEDMHASH
jgi:hypothetical protein